MRSANDFAKGPWLAAIDWRLKRLGLALPRTPKDDSIAAAIPAQKVPHHAHTGELPGVGPVFIHDPDLGPATLITVVGNQAAVRRIKWIDIDRSRGADRLHLAGCHCYGPNVRRAGAGREESDPLSIRRPVRLKVATPPLGKLTRTAIGKREKPD